MKMLSLLLFLVPFVSQASTEVIRLAADRASYTHGEKAVLRAMLASKPDNEDMEFDVEAKLDGALYTINRVTEFEFFSITPALTAGTHEWSAKVYLQDARLARDLKAAAAKFTNRIAEINLALETETDEAKRQLLLAEKAQQQRFLTATQAQLASIRTLIYGPASINLLVN